jgi:hypothetical protein
MVGSPLRRLRSNKDDIQPTSSGDAGTIRKGAWRSERADLTRLAIFTRLRECKRCNRLRSSGRCTG